MTEETQLISPPSSHEQLTANESEGAGHTDSTHSAESISSPGSRIQDVMFGNSDLGGDDLVALQRDLNERTVRLRDIKDYKILHRWTFPTISQASSEIWYRNLAAKGRGSPLWITGTNLNGPIQYRRSGISIGDVGLISNSGAFIFMFNIFLPADHPINQSAIKLPEGFVPLQPMNPTQIHEHSEFVSDRCFVGKSSTKVQIDIGIDGVSFELSRDEEVTLTMPQTSTSQDVIDTSMFREYIAANALNWYKLVNGLHRIEARNGDLRLVVGWDESNSFVQHVSSTTTFPKEVFVLDDPINGRVIGKVWKTVSAELCRSLPSPEVLSAPLRGAERSEEGALYKNERTFIRTLNISFSDAIWFNMAHEQGWLLLPNAEPVEIRAGGFPPPKFSALYRPPNTVLHPANGINALLLKMKPGANFAVTEDKEWISVLKPDDQLLPSEEEFLRRLLEVYEVHEDDGIVSLKPKPEDHPDLLDREHQPSGLKLLQKHVLTGALHKSAKLGNSPKLQGNARVPLIKEIMAWATDSYRLPQVLWMNGPAGAGKTAIAHRIAEMCDKAGNLAATFFPSRCNSGRNETTFIITTIVSQLVVVIPGMRESVGNALDGDSSLLSRSLDAHLDSLIIKPFEMARSDADDDDNFLQSLPKLIILDGLDDFIGPESHQSFLRSILAAFAQNNLPFSFLIASRPEQNIREVFDKSTIGLVSVQLVPEELDDQNAVEKDIRDFLVSRFQDIKDGHPSRTSLDSWPSEGDISHLVQKSSGLLIYAWTVMRFINSHRHWPPDRLHIILGILPPAKAVPFAELDALYSHILSATRENIGKILNIFVILLFLQSRHSDRLPTVQFIESFLSYRPGEVFTLLSDLHSVIYVPSPGEQDRLLCFFHVSFADFLLDRSRSGEEFFLDSGDSHRKIATWMLRELGDPSSTIVKAGLMEEFAGYCLQSTPTPEFLLKLSHFDMSLLPFKAGHFASVFGAGISDNRIPEFLVWVHQKRCPQWKENNHPQLYMRNVDIWIQAHLSWILEMCNRPDISDAVLAAVALVDFPEFRDVHDLIFEVFHAQDHGGDCYTFDPHQWEKYLKYRQFLSEFLMDSSRSGALCVGPAHYVALANCFWSFLVKKTTTKTNTDAFAKTKNIKAVMLTFPHILSRCGISVELSALLSRTRLPKRPWFRREPWPDGDDWESLVHTLERARHDYRRSVPKRTILDIVSSRITIFFQ